MNQKTLRMLSRRIIAVLIVLLIPFCAVTAAHVQASGGEASFINRLDDGIKVSYEDYLDSSVMYRLPDGVSDDEEISVIIDLDIVDLMDAYEDTDKSMSFAEFALQSEEARQIEAQISSEKAKILETLDQLAIKYTTGEDYSVLLSGFEIVIKAGDFETTVKSLGDGATAIVSEVYKKAETELVENTVNVFADTGIFDSSTVKYDGSGMVVAVLDTGLDYAHSAFSTGNFTSTSLGLTYDQVAALLGQTTAYKQSEGLGVDDVYISEKVPFGFDYADGDPDVYSTHNNHGTHVSGVIVGKDDTITGVAPNAQLVSMKIFSDTYDSAIASWILSALEDCVVLGVDVINMSLGTACGFSRESDEEAMNGVYEKIREAGISLIVAASNSYNSAYGSEANGNLGLTSNPDTGTVGSPSTYAGALSVASIKGTKTPYITYNDTIIYFDESTNSASKENNFFDTLLGDKDAQEYEFVVIPGVGRSADYTGMDVNGKIVLVRRGDNTFEEKAIIAQAQGAAGIIIYNNVSGDIKMNVGEATLAVCSISQDDGEMLAATGGGKIMISRDQTSGPFMDDFSSWGPTPDLKIKPEITAHGGNILSAVTGGSYDRLSGTSMACPNIAGVTILLRQYVVENFPEIADDSVKVNTMVNQLMMSTADIILNTNGLPYAVRKQGAGLANLQSAVTTPAYITTYDQDGNAMDKTKLELGDDPEKTGVYELSFTINNFGDSKLTYDLGYFVMTEGVSDTKTNAGETTVTGEAFLLEGAQVVIDSVSGGTVNGNKISVDAGQNANVKVTVTLSDSDKKYLDDSFENGMYVEGFITLTATEGTEIDLVVPYLAFYGDWTAAPMFDLDYFETNADELDDSIPVEDKTLPDAYSTRPIGGVTEDYVSYLGSYYFVQDPKDMIISANKDYIALSNQEGSIHSLRFVWAGLLRSAAKIEISITDDTTGEVVFECVDEDVRKSYGDGGSIYPANIEIEFDTIDYNLENNTEYTVKLVGYMDYGDGALETNEKNTFEFPLVMDFEAPAVTDVEFICEYDKTLEKNRLYAKVAVYDNHYAMAMQFGYVGTGTDTDGNTISEVKAFDQYMTPVYSQCDSTTYVTYELTDYIYAIKENAINDNSFVVTAYDYALNYVTYEIGLPDDFVDFYFEGIGDGISLSPNEIYDLVPLVNPVTQWSELLEFTSSRPSIARIVNNKIVAVAPGTAIIKVRDPATNVNTTFKVTVLGEEDEGYRRYDKPVADIFKLTGYTTNRAYYILDNNEKDIGDTGDVRFFEGNYNLAMYPSEMVTLNYMLDAYFPNDTTVEFETSNESIVTINEYGQVTAVAEGFASVTMKVMQDGKSTYYSETVSVEVKDPYVTTGASLTHYYGNGGLVVIPDRLTLTEIGAFAFSNFEYVLKTEEEMLYDDSSLSKQWFIGDSTITKVIIPEGVEKINAYAFANLTALEEVVLPSTLEAIEYGAFYGCSSLQKITFSGENNLKIINQNAFEGCDLQGTLELSSACVISDYAFAGNVDLKGIVLPETLQSIGQYAFAGCKSLADVTVAADYVKYGQYAFTGCESLTCFEVNSTVIPVGMFYECKSLETVKIGAAVNAIGEFAFRDTAVTGYEIADGNKTYKVQTAEYILTADGTGLVAVSPTRRGEFTADDLGGAKITAVVKGAFSHNTKISSVVLENVTSVGDYGFASAERLKSVKLGKLTYIGEYAFFETALTEMPAITAETEIGKYAFSFTALTSVTIPDGMEIAEGVFSECKSLAEVVIGNDVTLGKYAFNLSTDQAYVIKNYNEGDEKYFYYAFDSSLVSLTIGDNAVIGDNAFTNAVKLERVTLGDNAQIGYMAFYNNSALKKIDLSKAATIGDYAFSGDVYYICVDENMSVPAITSDGHYMYSYHAPVLEKVDVSAAESIGEYSFAYCRSLVDVVLNEAITEIPQYAFAGCEVIKNINLDKIVTVGDYAFIESGLEKIDLSAAESIGEYAFVYNEELTDVKLSANGTDIGEGTFSYCTSLKAPENIQYSENIGAYAFAYTPIVEIDLSGAVMIDDFAFLKEEITPFKVTLGAGLMTLGDNPFAMCVLEPFSTTEVVNFNGVDYGTVSYTYDLSENVSVIDGSLYCRIDTGLELITYAGTDHINAKIADGTVRITAYAFAGTEVKMVTLPYTVKAVGHKAFFGCESLETVIFTSYHAPILEEEFDSTYYESFLHLPGTGDFGTYTDYEGNEVSVVGMGLLPYYMWNATNSMYSNVFYGANFVDYVGYVEDKLMMVRPVNGQNYDTYIFNQYFDLVLDGPTGADDVTLAAIAAIQAIPERVAYEDKALVDAARAAYAKIATTEQQALVTNYAALVSAEQRIVALTPEEPVGGDVTDPDDDGTDKTSMIMGIALAGLALVGTVGGLAVKAAKAPKKEKSEKKAKAPKEKRAKKSKKAAEAVVEMTAGAETEVEAEAVVEVENTEAVEENTTEHNETEDRETEDRETEDRETEDRETEE